MAVRSQEKDLSNHHLIKHQGTKGFLPAAWQQKYAQGSRHSSQYKHLCLGWKSYTLTPYNAFFQLVKDEFPCPSLFKLCRSTILTV